MFAKTRAPCTETKLKFVISYFKVCDGTEAVALFKPSFRSFLNKHKIFNCRFLLETSW